MRFAERRRCPRFPFSLDCVAEFSRVYREVVLRNISMYGALIEARNLAVHFDGPDCTIRIRDDSRRTLELPAMVARGNEENLVALRWVHAGTNSQNDLRRLIWKTVSADQLPAYGSRLHVRADTSLARSAASSRSGKPRFGGAIVVWEEALLVHNSRQRGET
jgi:hypothetical protein